MAENSTRVEPSVQQLSLRCSQQLFSFRRMALGANVRRLRKERGWRLEDLSEKSGVEIGTINALERRNSKRSDYVKALAALPIAPTLALSAGAFLLGVGEWIQSSAADPGAAAHLLISRGYP
jgi:transcriptional regulator with XRE-family HTH domain